MMMLGPTSGLASRAEGPPLDRSGMQWVGDIPACWALIHPDRPAIVMPDHDRVVTYAQLHAQSARFGEIMRSRSVPPGARIAYLGRNSDLFFVALFGAIAGCYVLVPLNWRCAAPEIDYMLNDADPAIVITDAEFVPALASSSPPLLLTEGPSGLRAALRTPPVMVSPAPRDPDQVCLLLYTSGTTGKPKGVMLSHAALSVSRHVETVSADWADWNTADVVLSALPSFHIGGLAWMLIGLVRGLTTILTADAAPANLLNLIDRYRVTRTFIVPTLLRALLDLLRETGKSRPAIRTITYGAAAMSEAMLREAIGAIGCQFAQFFGMTECAGTVCFLSACDHDLDRPQLLTTVGRPQAGMAIEIRDAAGCVVPLGESGEIWVRSPAMMSGYWRLPDATEVAIVDGWYRTGDGGKLDHAGYLTITDRIRDMIISGGENVYPVQVEEVLRQHQGVHDAAVVGVPDAHWGERVVAVVEQNPAATVTEADLIAFAAVHLARYKCPKSVIFVEALPRTAMGKVQRAQVRAAASRSVQSSGYG